MAPPSSHTLMLLVDSSTHPSIHPHNRPPVHLFIHSWIVHLPVHLSLYLSIHSSTTSLSSHPCNDPHIHLPTHPSTHLLTKPSTQSSTDHPSVHSHMIYSYRHFDDTLNPTLVLVLKPLGNMYGVGEIISGRYLFHSNKQSNH